MTNLQWLKLNKGICRCVCMNYWNSMVSGHHSSFICFCSHCNSCLWTSNAPTFRERLLGNTCPKYMTLHCLRIKRQGYVSCLRSKLHRLHFISSLNIPLFLIIKTYKSGELILKKLSFLNQQYNHYFLVLLP